LTTAEKAPEENRAEKGEYGFGYGYGYE